MAMNRLSVSSLQGIGSFFQSLSITLIIVPFLVHHSKALNGKLPNEPFSLISIV